MFLKNLFSSPFQETFYEFLWLVEKSGHPLAFVQILDFSTKKSIANQLQITTYFKKTKNNHAKLLWTPSAILCIVFDLLSDFFLP
jgi:hypothetical protein